jgi:hypothetical protein
MQIATDLLLAVFRASDIPAKRKDHRGIDLISDALPFGRPVVRTSPGCDQQRLYDTTTLASVTSDWKKLAQLAYPRSRS